MNVPEDADVATTLPDRYNHTVPADVSWWVHPRPEQVRWRV